MKSFNRQQGFTLMELVIAVTIVGLLTAIALPSYLSSVVKGSRDSVQTELMQLAALQEKIYLNSNAYATSASTSSGNVITNGYNGTPTGGLGWSQNSKDNKYAFSCLPANCTASTYTLVATPIPGKGQQNDGTLSIDQMGNRLWTGGSAATW